MLGEIATLENAFYCARIVAFGVCCGFAIKTAYVACLLLTSSDTIVNTGLLQITIF